MYGGVAASAVASLFVVDVVVNCGLPPPMIVCVLFVLGCGAVAGLICALWAWSDAAEVTIPKRAPFGWLLLGFCWAVLIGHFIAIAIIPQGYYTEDIMGAMLVIIPITAIPGIYAGAAMERSYMRTGEPRLLKCWLILIVATIFHIFLVLPGAMAARE